MQLFRVWETTLLVRYDEKEKEMLPFGSPASAEPTTMKT